MTRPVRSIDTKVIDAVLAHVRECQAGMLGLSATPLKELTSGGKPPVGNDQAIYVADFCKCGRRVFWGSRLDVFHGFYAKLRDLDEIKAEQIVRSELKMDKYEWSSHRRAIECDSTFADVLREHQMYRRWMREEKDDSPRIGLRGERNGAAKLTSADAIEIRSHFRRDCRISVLAKFYDVSDSTISRIVRGETWR